MTTAAQGRSQKKTTTTHGHQPGRRYAVEEAIAFSKNPSRRWKEGKEHSDVKGEGSRSTRECPAD